MDSHHHGNIADRAANEAPPGGLSSLPVVGSAAASARQFYGHMAPRVADPTEVRVVKEIFRWSSVVAFAAAGALVVLDVPSARASA